MSQMEVIPEVVEIKNLTALEQERILFKAHATSIAAEAKAKIAAMKGQKGIDDAVAWCGDQKAFLKQVDASMTNIVRGKLHKLWLAFKGELGTYTDPIDKAVNDVMARVNIERAAIKRQLEKKEERINGKLEEKAKAQQVEQAEMFLNMGKPKAAESVLKKPLPYMPVKLEMPKIKGAVWRKTYQVRIDDLGKVLGYIAKNPKYHRMIDQEKLVSRLEGLAGELAGNMAEFDGITCFQGENHAITGGSK